jgi:hypothetical protein
MVNIRMFAYLRFKSSKGKDIFECNKKDVCSLSQKNKGTCYVGSEVPYPLEDTMPRCRASKYGTKLELMATHRMYRAEVEPSYFSYVQPKL